MARVKHGQGDAAGGEYTICGMAWDAFDAGDDEEIVFAKTGETITCELCRDVIRFMRRYKLDFKQP